MARLAATGPGGTAAYAAGSQGPAVNVWEENSRAACIRLRPRTVSSAPLPSSYVGAGQSGARMLGDVMGVVVMYQPICIIKY